MLAGTDGKEQALHALLLPNLVQKALLRGTLALHQELCSCISSHRGVMQPGKHARLCTGLQMYLNIQALM